MGVIQVQAESTGSALAGASEGDGERHVFAAGTEASGEFRCSGCGYGVVVRTLLPACPMCRGRVWEEPAANPFDD